jgi:ferritin-like metal-binding protein YciE
VQATEAVEGRRTIVHADTIPAPRKSYTPSGRNAFSSIFFPFSAEKHTREHPLSRFSFVSVSKFETARGAEDFPGPSNIKRRSNIMSMDSLKDLYIDELKDLYNAENQLVKALPKMAKKASAPELKRAFQDHLEQTKGHVDRLEKIFKGLGEKPTGKTCKAMKGLVEEGAEVIEEDGEDSVLDAALIGAAQRVEHYEMAGYGVVRTFASLLGENNAVAVLQRTLNEEGEADKKLTKLAESIINVDASKAEKNGAPKSKAKKSARRK